MLVRGLLVLATLGCSRPPQPIDIMRQPPVCDVPTPILASPVARFPANVRSDSRYATLIGFVADSLGRVVGQGQLLLDPKPGQILPPQYAITDSTGAFVLSGVAEGEHELLFRAIGYISERRRVSVRNGDILTMPVRLRFYRCLGY
jgi:hypothetical protein